MFCDFEFRNNCLKNLVLFNFSIARRCTLARVQLKFTRKLAFYSLICIYILVSCPFQHFILSCVYYCADPLFFQFLECNYYCHCEHFSIIKFMDLFLILFFVWFSLVKGVSQLSTVSLMFARYLQLSNFLFFITLLIVNKV